MTPSVMNDPPPPADLRLPYGDHPSQFVDFRRSHVPGVRPLVVMIHGGFWRARRDLTYAGHLCIALAQAGYATANIEYRRVGEEGGGWPGTFDDVKRAIEFARENAPSFDADSARPVVLGHSAGGHLALWVAAEIPDLAGVIGLGAVANLRRCWELNLSNGAVLELMGGTPDEHPERYSAGDPAVRPAEVKRVLIHGVNDDIVPVEMTRDYPMTAHVVQLAGADHFAVIDPSSAVWPEVLAAIRALK
jgi:dipeptidyl aminopeptidase/acylaminoacyl peptidase